MFLGQWCVEDHVLGNAHQRFVANLRPRLPKSEQKRMAEWQSSCKATAAKHLEVICERQQALEQKLKPTLFGGTKASSSEEARESWLSSLPVVYKIVLSVCVFV